MEMYEYQLRTAETAIYPDAGESTILALSYVALGASNEAGEVAGKVKKIIRDGYGERPMGKKLQILDEIGDTLWYLARLCDELGFCMDLAAERNLEKLTSRKTRGTLHGSGDNR